MDDQIASVVRRHGWFAANIEDTTPPFMYSIGLVATLDHPDFILFGLNPDDAHAVLNSLVAEVRGGGRFGGTPTVGVTTAGGELHLAFRPVHPTRHQTHLGFAMGHYRHIGRSGDLRVLQVFWPDADGRYPFDAGCEESVWDRQPRLDVGLTDREVAEFEDKFA